VSCEISLVTFLVTFTLSTPDSIGGTAAGGAEGACQCRPTCRSRHAGLLDFPIDLRIIAVRGIHSGRRRCRGLFAARFVGVGL